jgi:hypothetical protein
LKKSIVEQDEQGNAAGYYQVGKIISGKIRSFAGGND